MSDSPVRTWRRFFQFRLSTWFVLVGIAAWVMACRPTITCTRATINHSGTQRSAGIRVYFTSLPYALVPKFNGKQSDRLCIEFIADTGLRIHYLWIVVRQRAVIYALLAFIALFACKGFWLIGQRWRGPVEACNPIAAPKKRVTIIGRPPIDGCLWLVLAALIGLIAIALLIPTVD